jgi:hypothetical protein
MIVLKILLALLFCFLVMVVGQFINARSERRYNFRPFTLKKITTSMLIATLLIITWFISGSKDQLNPILLLSVYCVCSVAYLVYFYKKAGWLYGVGCGLINLVLSFLFCLAFASYHILKSFLDELGNKQKIEVKVSK